MTKKETQTTAPAGKESSAKESPDSSKESGGDGKSDHKAGDSNTSQGYSRGEGQKPTTAAYRNNWKSIFGEKKSGRRANKSTKSKRTR